MTILTIFTSTGTPYAASLSKLLSKHNSSIRTHTYYVGEEPFWTKTSVKLGPRSKTWLSSKILHFSDYIGMSIFFRKFMPNNLQGNIAYDTHMASEAMSIFKTDISIFFWGTIWKKFIIDNMNAKFGRKVLIVNTYPLHFSKQEKIEGDDIKYFEFFDILIVPTKFMREYLIKNLGINKNKIHVIPEFISQGTVREVSQKRWSKNRKKIVFLGNMKNIRQADNVKKDLVLLTELGFEVYVQGEKDQHELFKTYPSFTTEQILEGKLSEFLMDFGFIYYGYNTSGSTREQQSITTRFSLAEYCDLPIILDKDKYRGLIEEFKVCCQFVDTTELGSDFEKLNLSEHRKQYLELRQNELLRLILCH